MKNANERLGKALLPVSLSTEILKWTVAYSGTLGARTLITIMITRTGTSTDSADTHILAEATAALRTEGFRGEVVLSSEILPIIAKRVLCSKDLPRLKREAARASGQNFDG